MVDRGDETAVTMQCALPKKKTVTSCLRVKSAFCWIKETSSTRVDTSHIIRLVSPKTRSRRRQRHKETDV